MQPLDTLDGVDLAPSHLRLLRALLTAHAPGAEILAFGSRVNGGSHEGSDLDLVVRDPGNAEQPVAGVARLREAFENSALPMRIDVHDWAALPPGFRAEIERSHLRLPPA